MESESRIGLPFMETFVEKGFEIKTEGQSNLDVLQDTQAPVVIFFNHNTIDDPFLLFHAVHSHAPARFKNAIMPVSEEYAKFKNYPAYSTAVGVARSLWGVRMPKVVQSYRLRNDEGVPKELYSKAETLGKEFKKKLDAEIGQQKEGVAPIVIISPEGHRSKNGALLPAEAGLGLMAKIMERKKKKEAIEHGYFLPVGIVFQKYSHDKLYYNPLEKPVVTLNVGEAEEIGEVIKGSRQLAGKFPNRKYVTHYLMGNLANLLPDEMKGYYGAGKVEDTIEGRYEQRMSGGEVYVSDLWETGAS